jgi:hydrogenase nickel incorporation protein HypA/HybF
MHEISICEGIIQLLKVEAKKQHFDKVTTLWLEIGELASVEVEALRFSFGIVSQGTLAQDATLKIEQPAGQAWCQGCLKTIAINARYQPCELCGGHQLQLTQGDEMRIKELEVA